MPPITTATVCDPRVDACIARSAEFARPILTHLREVVHARGEQAMGQFGRITRMADLPPQRVLEGYGKQALRLHEAGIGSPARSKPRAAKPPAMPADVRRALAQSAKARATYDALSRSGRREYVDWISEARPPDRATTGPAQRRSSRSIE
ncbi:MAG TPA: YdeI/OmpD-associated family protein [Gemmatimonadales bacterium]|nr:YdeI/OmpD-associated family protein [Gemmatimonadales bacterium]